MATIMIVMLPETGHLNPTYKLAKALKRRGHRVCYSSAPDYETEIRERGLEFIPFFTEAPQEEPLAADLANGAEDFSCDSGLSVGQLTDNQACDVLAQTQRFNELVVEYRPDLFLVDMYTPAIALMAHRAGVQSVFLNTSLNAFDDYGGASAFEPVLKIPELVLCPQELDLPRPSQGRRRFYLGPSIDLDKAGGDFPWQRIRKDKPLIYCSLGTQSRFFEAESRILIQSVIGAMWARRDWQAVIATGARMNPNSFSEVHVNTVLVSRAPQLEILKRASLMITHGGLGSVKECIHFGVPMIVFPGVGDQPHNATRVVHHGLGARGDIRKVSIEVVQSLIDKVDKNPMFKSRVEAMSRKFKEIEAEDKGTRIIEKILAALAARDKNRLKMG